MALINPHLNYNGNAEEAFNFYKSVFGGEFVKIIRFKDLSNEDFAGATSFFSTFTSSVFVCFLTIMYELLDSSC